MRIAVNARFSAKKTGIGRVVEKLLDELQDLDKSNEYLIYVNPEFLDLFPVRNPNFHLVSNGVAAGDLIGNHVWTQVGFQRRVLKEKIDLVIYPGIALILFEFRKIIYFQHDLIEFYIPNQKWYKLLFRRIAFPLAIRLSDRIVCVSENTRRDVLKFFHPPEAKVRVIPNGVDLSAFRPVPIDQAREKLRTRYGIEGDFLLFTGTLTHPQKNLLNLLEAYGRMARSGRPDRMVLVGNPGKDYHLIQQKIQDLDLGDRVVLTGYVPDADQADFYSAARAFCFPSFYEGFGLPVLEAMACGCPVIASDTSSLPEVVGDAGLLVPPDSPDAIHGAMLRILTDEPCRQALIQKGFERTGVFTWKAASLKLLSVIQEFAGGRA